MMMRSETQVVLLTFVFAVVDVAARHYPTCADAGNDPLSAAKFHKFCDAPKAIQSDGRFKYVCSEEDVKSPATGAKVADYGYVEPSTL